MEHTIVHQQDKKYIRFIEYLRRLSKEELIDLISEYWITLKTAGEKNLKDKNNYLVKEFGGIKLTQVNRLYAMTFHKAVREKI